MLRSEKQLGLENLNIYKKFKLNVEKSKIKFNKINTKYKK